MLYHWLGREKFAAGLQSYLRRHQGSCGTNTKLWSALEEHCSEIDINGVMTNWVTVQGYPLVHVSISEDTIHLKQEQYGNSPYNIWGRNGQISTFSTRKLVNLTTVLRRTMILYW